MSTISAEQPAKAARGNGEFLALIARAIVGGLFVISAIGKIMAPEEFAKEIREYEMLPLAITNAIAYILPWIELFAGAMLVLCMWRKESRGVIALMLLVFTIAKTVTYAQGKVIDCGCGGQIEFLKYIYNSPQGIVTNLILLALLCVDHRAQRLSAAAKSGPRDESTAAGE